MIRQVHVVMAWSDWYTHSDGKSKSKQLIDQQGISCLNSSACWGLTRIYLGNVLCLRIRPRNGPQDGTADRYEEGGERIRQGRVSTLEAQAKYADTPRDVSVVDAPPQQLDVQGQAPLPESREPSFIAKPSAPRRTTR